MAPLTIQHVAIAPFTLPLRSPFVTAAGTIAARAGFAIQIASTAGAIGWGEATPLAGFGMESLADTECALQQTSLQVEGQTIAGLAEIDALCAPLAATPAARHGLELALCHLLAQHRQCAIAALLNPNPRARVAVNATIGAVPVAIAAQQAQRAIAQGYRCLKLKVGTADPEADWERVAAVRAIAGGDIALRLDANQGWTVPEAIAHLGRFARLGIEYVEQPVADLAGLAAVRQASPIPIAVDEAVTSIATLERAIALHAADLVILKPMALGGILAAWQAAERARAAGLEVVVTTTLDGAIARWGALQLAAALPYLTRPCGLATGRFLAEDLPVPPGCDLTIRQGCLRAMPS